MSTEIDRYKTQFLEYMEIERGASLKTIENYDRYLSHFFSYTKTTRVRDITEESIRTYRLHLNRELGAKVKGQTQATMKKNTQNYYLIALRMFLKYLMKRSVEALSPDKIELAKIKERSLDLISALDLSRLINAPDKNTGKGLRDHAILELFFSTGLRLSELCSLNRDLDLSKDEFSIRGKGEKVRVAFLSPPAKNSVREYLKARKDMQEPLFVQYSRNKSSTGRLSPRSIERLVKEYAIK